MNRDYGKHRHRASEYTTINFDDDPFEVTSAAVVPPTSEGDRPTDYGFISFGSGSSGNCAYLGTFQSGILIDAGVDIDQVFDALQRNGVREQAVKGILLTHDHQDHVRYVYTCVRNHKHLRVYCTPKLMVGLLRRHNISKRIRDYHEAIYKEIPFKLAKMEITAFETSHDGSDNMGFSIQIGDRIFVVATDMGVITDRASYYMSQAHYLMIESNYDRQMLDTGRYPEYLKARVRGEKGHLDNKEAAAFVAEHYHEGLRNVFLCHLSNDNNRPEIARDTMAMALQARGLTVGDGSNAPDQRGRDIQVYALPRFQSSHWFVL
ncbi:MAG: MBL fold metallo-hydrolase [Muribaculaceae bacterium]|nr:MBL fold metallo-hydrolase [Muribaculaceae bacterium]